MSAPLSQVGAMNIFYHARRVIFRRDFVCHFLSKCYIRNTGISQYMCFVWQMQYLCAVLCNRCINCVLCIRCITCVLCTRCSSCVLCNRCSTCVLCKRYITCVLCNRSIPDSVCVLPAYLWDPHVPPGDCNGTVYRTRLHHLLETLLPPFRRSVPPSHQVPPAVQQVHRTLCWFLNWHFYIVMAVNVTI